MTAISPIGMDIPTAGDVVVIGAGPTGDLTSQPVLDTVRAAVNHAWRTSVQPRLTEILARELGQPDRFYDGVTLYDLTIRLSPDDPVQTIQRTESGDVLVHVVTGRSTIIATATQPTLLGDWADPRLSVDFSVSFDILLDIPPVTGPVGGSQVLNLRLIAPHVDSQNLAGDVLKAVVTLVVEVIGGGDIDQMVADAANGALAADEVNAALGPLNAALDAMLAAGHRYLTLHAGDVDDLLRQLGKRADQVAPTIRSLPADTQSLMLVCRAPDESGVIEGEVSWLESAGRPVDPTQFALLSSVAEGLLPTTALTRVRDALAAPVPMEVLAAGAGAADTPLEGARLARAATDFVVAPMAAQVQEASLGGSPGVRIWDAATTPEPPEVGRLGFAEMSVDAARRSLRAFEPAAYETLMDVFRRGPKQFSIPVSVAEPGGGSHRTGRLVAMWADSSDGWSRRRFRIEGVETGVPLTVTCALAKDWRWLPGSIEAVKPRNWSGTVTVHKAREFGHLLGEGDLQVSFGTKDGSRRTVSIAALEQAGAIPRGPEGQRSVVIDSGTPGDEVALNPQPLPPKWRDRLGAARGDDRAIIVVGGRPGEDVSLNPQPLPPKWRQEVADIVAGLRVGQAQPRIGQRHLEGAGQGVVLHRGVGGVPRGAGTAILRGGAGPIGRGGGALRGPEGVAQQRQGGRVDGAAAAVDPTLTAAATAVVAAVDRFGDLVTSIDPDVVIPDTVNPSGYGSVRGIDFRVWPAG